MIKDITQSKEWQIFTNSPDGAKRYDGNGTAFKAGLWSMVVGLAKEIRFNHYQDYSIFFFNVEAVMDKLNANMRKGADQEVFLDALQGVKSIEKEFDSFVKNYGIHKDIKGKYQSMIAACKSEFKEILSGLRELIAPDDSHALGRGKTGDKIGPIKASMNRVAGMFAKIGSLLKEFYKGKLGDDDFVHTEKRSRTQEQLNEHLSVLRDELIDILSNIKSFSRLPFTYKTETSYDYDDIPVPSSSSGKLGRGASPSPMSSPRVSKNQKHEMVKGSKQYAIIEESKTFKKFYYKWYSNFYREFKIYPRPLGSIQGLIDPVMEDFEYFTTNESIRFDEKAFNTACDVMTGQIAKVLNTLAQIKLE